MTFSLWCVYVTDHLSGLASAAVWLSENEALNENSFKIAVMKLAGIAVTISSTWLHALLRSHTVITLGKKYLWKFNHKYFSEAYFHEILSGVCFCPLWSYLETFWPDS